MRWPLIVVRYGRYASAASCPIPVTGSLDAAIAANVSCMPAGP